MRSCRFLRMVLVGSLAFGLAACGDDDSGGGDATEDTATADLPDDVPGAVEAFLDEDCEFLAAGSFMNPGAALTPGGDFDFDENRARFEALADDAPDEIAEDLDTIADRMGQMEEALGDVDLSDPASYGDPEVQAALGELDEIFDDEYRAATTAVSTFVAENCTG